MDFTTLLIAGFGVFAFMTWKSRRKHLIPAGNPNQNTLLQEAGKLLLSATMGIHLLVKNLQSFMMPTPNSCLMLQIIQPSKAYKFSINSNQKEEEKFDSIEP
jgi:hypothetical protein